MTTFERLTDGLGFGEGPVWHPAGWLIFSDIARNRMLEWNAIHGVRVFRSPSNKANGNTFDRAGRIVTCEHGLSRVVREDASGVLTVLASTYEGKGLNSPNDVIVGSDGSIYFTDPTYGRIRDDVGVPRPLELDFRGVYRIPPEGGLELLASDFDQPNGLCLSRDESFLFVNDTPRKHIRRFAIGKGLTVSGGEIWAELKGSAPGVPDGMKCDGLGNIWCTGPGGLHAFDPRGGLLRVLQTPERATNFFLGGPKPSDVFITSPGALHRGTVNT